MSPPPAGALSTILPIKTKQGGCGLVWCGVGEILLLFTNIVLGTMFFSYSKSFINHFLIFLLEFQSAEDAEEFGEEFDPPYPAVNFLIEMFDYLAVGFFTLEYIVRFLCCPRKLKFFFG